jgi:hypothetical protein
MNQFQTHFMKKILGQQQVYFKNFKLLSYTRAGLDLTTHNSAGGGVATRPRRQGKQQLVYNFYCFLTD